MTIYRTTKGDLIDVTPIIEKNAHRVAAGNTRMNAKGDTLGKGGTVIRSAKKKAQQAHNAAKEVREVGLGNKKQAEALEDILDGKKEKKATSAKPQKEKKTREVELDDGSIEIVDDDYLRDE